MHPSSRATRRALIVTGEASGDLHGANLIKAARTVDPELQFFGVGGRLMEEQGCELLLRGEELAVVGIVEIAAHFPAIYRAFKQLESLLKSAQRPDVLVLIDFPEFNLRLAKKAKEAGVPVLYYVSPQVWAWRRGRVKTIARRVDRLAAIFPFEPELYQGLDIEVEYVGHPLASEARASRQRDDYLAAHGLDPRRPVVGLFPGSRRSELKYIFASIAASADLLRRRHPEVQFVLPVAASLEPALVRELLQSFGLPVTLVQDNIYDCAGACDAVICVSGTVTLQLALMQTPMAIVYRVHPLTYAIGKRLIKVAHIGLANIVAGHGVVREFIQHQVTPDNIAGEIARILTDSAYRDTMRAQLGTVRSRLGGPGCSHKVATMASEMSRGQLRSGARE